MGRLPSLVKDSSAMLNSCSVLLELSVLNVTIFVYRKLFSIIRPGMRKL